MIATLLFVLFINFFLFHSFGSTTLALIILGLLVYVHVTGRARVNGLVLWISVCIVLAAATIVLRANHFVGFIATCCSFALLAQLVYVTRAGGGMFWRISELLYMPLRLIGGYLGGMITALEKVASSKSNSNIFSWGKSIVVGLVVGIPVAAVLLGLFSGADPVFGSSVESFFGKELMHRVATHLFVSSIVFLFLLPVVFLSVTRMKDGAFASLSGWTFAREMTVISGLIALVVGAFLWVQWPYVFAKVAAETGLSQFGAATYSEYVKRGFVEFLFIAVVLYALIWVGLLVLRGKGKKTVLQMTQMVVLGEIVLYVISLFRRIWLYQELHGLSIGRVYGGFFLLWVMLLLSTLLARHVWPKVRWVMIEWVGTMVVFLVFAFGNVEQYVASERPPTVNNRVDVVYLSRLSADDYTGWQKAFVYVSDMMSDQRFMEKNILNASDRQAIAYGGMILRHLTGNYHHLIELYGSDAEIDAYGRGVLAFQEERIAEVKPDVMRRASDEAKAGMLNGAYIEMLRDLDADTVWIDGQLNSSGFRASDALRRIHTAYMYGLDLPFSAVSLYSIERDGKQRPLDQWDKVLSWNWSDQKTYQRMKEDMPFTELLGLQHEYLLLSARVAAQPADEQGYESDISPDGPFLQ